MMGQGRAAALVLLGAALSGAVQAAPPPSPFDVNPARFVQLTRSDPFIVGICNRDRATLLGQLRHRRTQLQAQLEQLQAAAGDGRLSARDVLLTILLPGGLVYAAQRHDQMQRAQALRGQVDRRLQELTAELHRWEAQAALSAGLQSR